MTSRKSNSEENRKIAAMCQVALMLDDARLYGFVEGPKVDREHCFAVLERLEREGIVPTEEEIEVAVRATVEALT